MLIRLGNITVSTFENKYGNGDFSIMCENQNGDLPNLNLLPTDYHGEIKRCTSFMSTFYYKNKSQ